MKFEKPVTYIELSDGRVGYVEDLENKQFKKDLKRNNLTYIITTRSAYTRYMITTKLSPEQIYRQYGGKRRCYNDKRRLD